MELAELRPHIQSRIAHEFGSNFLDELIFSIKNKFLEKDTFITGIYESKELAKQDGPKYEPGLLMDALISSALKCNHRAVIKDTNPKGHQFVQMTTPSCHIVTMRNNSINTKKAKFYVEKTLSNIGLVKNPQDDLFIKAILNEDANLDDLLFVCVTSYWNSSHEILDINFIVPHPTKNYPIFHFSLE